MTSKLGLRLTGLVFIVVIALLISLSIALYNQTFSRPTIVTLYTSNVGNEMIPDADVMSRGVLIGEVRSITASGNGAKLELALQPAVASRLPANVTAELLPTTLFGQRYVDLIYPAAPSGQTLASSPVIRENRSQDAIELQRVLNDVLPTLTAVRPAELAVTFTAIAQALQGRGTKLGQTLVDINKVLRQVDPKLGVLDHDLTQLAQVARSYSASTPDLLQALNDFSVTGQTIVAERASLNSLYGTVTASVQNLRNFVASNSSNLINLAVNSEPTLRILARYSAEFPCVFAGLVRFEPNINKALGAGTSKPGLHVSVHVVPSLGRYKPSVNTPFYGDNLGPHCYPVPFPGIRLNDGASQPASGPATPPGGLGGPVKTGGGTAASYQVTTPGNLGLPNSAAENELINELLAVSLNSPPDSLPSWSSVLVGPLYRGTEVNLRP